jgi:hypothetical protein
VDNVCNDVAKNLALFGIASQAKPCPQLKKANKPEFPNQFASNPTPAGKEDIFSAYSSLMNTLQMDASKDNESKTKRDLLNQQSEGSLIASIFSPSKTDSSQVSEEKAKDGNKSLMVEGSFNVLGMFKPGEFLNALS